MVMDTVSFRLITDMFTMETRLEDKLVRDILKRCLSFWGRKVGEECSKIFEVFLGRRVLRGRCVRLVI